MTETPDAPQPPGDHQAPGGPQAPDAALQLPHTEAVPTPDPQRTLAPTAAETTDENPWPLSYFAHNLKTHIERVSNTWVEGQLIEVNHRRGSVFATMRDLEEEASLSLAIWGDVARSLETRPDVGQRVVARIKPNFWLKTGRLSMRVTDMKPVGEGELLLRLEKLRRSLAAEGLFDPDRKKPIPFLPQRIGLITGAHSDAEKDVLRNAELRWPAVAFEIRHVAVQGTRNVPEVLAALEDLDADPRVDVIVIARGGGSLEDLLGFSDERIIRAVASAQTPVVSAIGHENDRPILDDVADLRASTPTDAAKRIIPDVAVEKATILEGLTRINAAMNTMLARARTDLEDRRSRPVLKQPERMVEERRTELSQWEGRLEISMRTALTHSRQEVTHLLDRVRSLSPQKTLERGYSVLQDSTTGRVIMHTEQAPEGSELTARLSDGTLLLTSAGARIASADTQD